MSKNVKVLGAKRRVPFAVRVLNAREVRVTGEFCQWTTEGIPLNPDGSGQWRNVFLLEPGKYEYRLLIDGEWRSHPEAGKRVENSLGTANGVLEVE